MNSIESILKIVSETRKSCAGNMTINEMLYKLNQYDDNEKIVLSDTKFFDGTFDSYRGYYEDLYLGYCLEDKGFNTVGKIKQILNNALEEGMMYGYKGGEFSICRDTLVWLAEYGDCGDMIIDIQKINGVVVVITKEDEY